MVAPENCKALKLRRFRRMAKNSGFAQFVRTGRIGKGNAAPDKVRRKSLLCHHQPALQRSASFVLGGMSVSQLDQVARITGKPAPAPMSIRGYRGHGLNRDRVGNPCIPHAGASPSPTIRRELQGRNEIEPVIGRMKQDGFWEARSTPRSWRETFNVMLCAIRPTTSGSRSSASPALYWGRRLPKRVHSRRHE